MSRFQFAAVCLITCLASGASANQKPPVITLGGSLDTQFGYVSQKYPFNSININSSDPLLPEVFEKIDKYGIVNDTKIDIDIYGHTNCFKYGGFIRLNADTSTSKEGENSVAHQTMMYVESNLGRLEAGSYTGSYDAMKVNGASLARATGGIDGDWRYWANTAVDGPLNIATGHGINLLIFSPSLPTAFDKSYEANASKISYYTPIFNGFEAGITYIPDTEQHGTVTNLRPLLSSATTNLALYNQTRSFRNVFQGGFSYQGKFDKVCFKLSALGEVGDAKRLLSPGGAVIRHDLQAYEIGAKASYMGFGLAGSYGDWGKSGIPKTLMIVAPTTFVPFPGAKSGSYWTAGVNYVHHCYGLSFGYLGSENGGFIDSTVGIGGPKLSPVKGKTRLYSFGFDYKVAPGFMPYAEITWFDLKNGAIFDTGSLGPKNKGTVFLAGSKLEF